VPFLKNSYIIDGNCKYNIKNKEIYTFVDFEHIFNNLDDSIKNKLSLNKEHCDAILVSNNSVEIIEMSMNTDRDLLEFLNKFEYCMNFLEYLNKNRISLFQEEIKLVTVINPNKLMEFYQYSKNFKNLLKHYKKNILLKYDPQLVPISCED